jgi:hypothetical protein
VQELAHSSRGVVLGLDPEEYLSQPLWLLFIQIALLVCIAECGCRSMRHAQVAWRMWWFGEWFHTCLRACMPCCRLLTQAGVLVVVSVCVVAWQGSWVGSASKCKCCLTRQRCVLCRCIASSLAGPASSRGSSCLLLRHSSPSCWSAVDWQHWQCCL